MADYLYLVHPYRHGFFDSPTEEEAAVIEEHFRYLEQAAEKGIVLLAGPCQDDTFGLIIFRASDEAAANAFMLNDPVVRKNMMAAELHPLRISLLGQWNADWQR